MDIQGRARLGDVDAQLELAQLYQQGGNVDLARGWFARAVQCGSAKGLYGLAASLLTQSPLSVGEGVAMMRQAAAQGDADAAHVCAVIAAQDTALPGHWDVARRYLDLAAVNGSAMARDVLTLLPADPGAMMPTAERVADEPRIEVCRGFASGPECRWLIARAQPWLKAAELYDPQHGRGFRGQSIRNNRDTSFNLLQSDLVIAAFRNRIATWTGQDIHAMEPPMVLQYAQGQYFAPHRDALDPGVPAMAEQIRLQGQRVATVLVYLNDDYAGGETDFPELGWRFKGRTGDALCFWNVDAAGLPAAQSLHAGLPPQGGVKWAFSQWIRSTA